MCQWPQPRRSYVLSGRRPKPDVGNLQSQAHAPLPANRLDMRACHPASEVRRPSMTEGFPRPAFGLSPKARRHCSVPSRRQVQSGRRSVLNGEGQALRAQGISAAILEIARRRANVSLGAKLSSCSHVPALRDCAEFSDKATADREKAHGLRRIDHTNADRLVISADRATSQAGKRLIIERLLCR
jgi:hypothetical protein